MVDYDSPDIASEIDRHRLAAYERLQAINADLLAALEALIAIGPKQKPPKIMEGSIAARNWGLFEAARLVATKARKE